MDKLKVNTTAEASKSKGIGGLSKEDTKELTKKSPIKKKTFFSIKKD